MSQDPLSFKQERVIFYAQLGLAIGRWSRVEANLFQFMNYSFKTNEQAKLSIAYLSVENFRSKLQVVDRLVCEVHSKNKHFGEWQSLHKRLDTCSKLRNKIAHNQIIQCTGNPGRRIGVAPNLDAIVPFFKAVERQEEIRRSTAPKGTLFIRDIALCRMQFESLLDDMVVAHSRLFHNSERQQEFPKRADRPPTIAQMRKEIGDRFRLPRKASDKLPRGAYE